ncbi:hypothetical protein L209DRAFT_752982 [Thermothelomyces heterothallicus CBS 203.75]
MPEYRTGQGRHMAARLFDRIQGLYQSLTRQQEVVAHQEEAVQTLQEANVFVDVERLTGISMEEETRQLQTTCGILDDLNTRLCEAIDLWSKVSFDDGSCEELTQTQASVAQSPSPNPPAEELKELLRRPKCQHFTPPSLGDPAVGTQSRYQTQWKNWTKAPAIQDPASLILSRPTRWWMEERSHYALCQSSEQAQLESSADAVRFHRAYNHATLPVVALPAPVQYYQSSAREVSQAAYYPYDPSALTPPPLQGDQLSKLSYGRRAREDSVDFWLDDDYDPDFWQKNLRPGNIWTDPPRRPVPDDDPVSPRAVPASWSALSGG